MYMQIHDYRIPDHLHYDHKNYWVDIHKDKVVVGMSDYGQSTIGDILYLDLGKPGTALTKGQELGSIEAGKWVGLLTAPVSGTIKKINEEIEKTPASVNNDPYGKGWMYEITSSKPAELQELMPASEYAKWVDAQVKMEDEEGLR
jgi:glycine cleavage system H protein